MRNGETDTPDGLEAPSSDPKENIPSYVSDVLLSTERYGWPALGRYDQVPPIISTLPERTKDYLKKIYTPLPPDLTQEQTEWSRELRELIIDYQQSLGDKPGIIAYGNTENRPDMDIVKLVSFTHPDQDYQVNVFLHRLIHTNVREMNERYESPHNTTSSQVIERYLQTPPLHRAASPWVTKEATRILEKYWQSFTPYPQVFGSIEISIKPYDVNQLEEHYVLSPRDLHNPDKLTELHKHSPPLRELLEKMKPMQTLQDMYKVVIRESYVTSDSGETLQIKLAGPHHEDRRTKRGHTEEIQIAQMEITPLDASKTALEATHGFPIPEQTRSYSINMFGDTAQALRKGEPIFMRWESMCYYGIIVDSANCDCGEQFNRTKDIMGHVAEQGEGAGILVLAWHQMGKNTGIMQHTGLNRGIEEFYEKQVGIKPRGAVKYIDRLSEPFPAIAGATDYRRDYRDIQYILQQLKEVYGVDKIPDRIPIRILTNNPEKMNVMKAALEKIGFQVDYVSLTAEFTDENYVELTRKGQLGHQAYRAIK